MIFALAGAPSLLYGALLLAKWIPSPRLPYPELLALSLLVLGILLLACSVKLLLRPS